MSWLDGLRHRLRTVLDPRGHERELQEEMRLHLELDAMQQRDRDRARRRFGNRTYFAEETRRMTSLASFDVLRQDARYAWRSLARTPGFTALVILTLALGIGVNAATFTLLDRIYLRPPPGVADPSSIRRLWMEHFQLRSIDQWSVSGSYLASGMNYPQYRAIAEAAENPDAVALYSTDYSLRLGRDPGAAQVRAVYATANYFSVLGVRPELGRFYTKDEDRLGSGPTVLVVSHRFWQNHLGADSAILGKPLSLGKNQYTVIGVAQRSFVGLDLQAADVFIPLGSKPTPPWMSKPWWEHVDNYGHTAIRRVDRGISETPFLNRATLAVRSTNRAVVDSYRDTLMKVHTGPILEARGPGTLGQDLLISLRLGGVAVIVLLIACANVVNLLLSRAVRRRREIAVRLALGVSRWRLVRLLTTETLLLATLAGGAALLAAWWGGALLRSRVMPEVAWSDSTLDWRAGAFTLAVALFAGLISGIVPAVQASRPQLARALKEGSRDGTMHRSRLRNGLVIVQAALSVMLLVGAALFVQSLRNVEGMDLGYDSRQILFASASFEEGTEPPAAVQAAAVQEVGDRFAKRPGVEAVAQTAMQPMTGFSMIVAYFGTESTESLAKSNPSHLVVGPTFFEAVGMSFLRGSTFTPGIGGRQQVIINEALANMAWPGQDPVGQCIRLRKRDNPCYAIVGVVETARRANLIESPAPQYYFPLGHAPDEGWEGTTLIVRTRDANDAALRAELMAAFQRAFPTATPKVNSMSEDLEPEYRPWRLGAALFTAFGLLALLVAVVGIYSTVSYSVHQRTHEFGVRIALGARVRDILSQVLDEGLRVVLVGVVVGIALALAAGRLISALLFGVEPSDPSVMLLVSCTLVIVAGLAAVVPAWRAARVDPVTALRAD